MFINLLIFILLMSWSVFWALKKDKRIEDTLPVAVMGICIIIFICGLLGHINIGVYISLLICITFWIVNIIILIKHNQYIYANLKSVLLNIITPGFISFSIFYILMNIFLYGLMGNSYDEFSHWMTCIKNMVKYSDFSTNPLSTDLYCSYPPGTALLQYFFQRIHILLTNNLILKEWICYLAYSSYLFIVCLPLFRKTSIKKWNMTIGIVATTILIPMLFFPNVYHELLVDPFLAVLSGACVSTILLRDNNEKDIFYHLTIIFMLVTLVLAKDIGMMLAIFAFIIYAFDILFEIIEKDKLMNYKVIFIVTGLLSIIITKKMWNYEIRDGIIAFSNGIDFKELFLIISGRISEGYRVEVYNNYWRALFERTLKLGSLRLEVNYFALLIATSLISYINLGIYKKDCDDKKKRVLVFVVLLVETIGYYIGLCFIYMYNFIEYEALQYASLERYLNIVILTSLLTSLFALFNNLSIRNIRLYNIISISTIIIICLIIPIDEVRDVVTRKNVADSIQLRALFDNISNKLINICDGDDKVLMINQGGQPGFDGIIVDYNIMPNRCKEISIGEPCFDGDIWTVPVSNSNEFLDYINTQMSGVKIDYICTFRLNDYFYQHFSDMFNNLNDINENCVYRFNPITNSFDLVI